jgi:hypothetical protein
MSGAMRPASRIHRIARPWVVGIAAGLLCGSLAAADAELPLEPAPPPAPVDRATLETSRLVAQEGQRVEVAEQPVLDPAIFTEISPYGAAQEAVRVPDDQRLE